MINEAEVVRRLTQVCPGFAPSLAAYEASEGRLDEAFNVMSELAKWVVTQSKSGSLECFDELFNEFETLLRNADPDAHQVLVIGFMEDIHNFAVRLEEPMKRADPDVFLPYLGVRSRNEWFRLVGTYVQWGERWPGRLTE